MHPFTENDHTLYPGENLPKNYLGTLLSLHLVGEQRSLECRNLMTGINTLIQDSTTPPEAQHRLSEACKNFIDCWMAIQSQTTLMMMELQELAREVELSLASVLQELAPKPFPQEQEYQTSSSERSSQAMARMPSNRWEQERQKESQSLPGLSVTCFGSFSLVRLGKPLPLCNNRNGQAILRYLIAQKGHRASIDELTDTFWPEDGLTVARRKLQVSISLLRSTLNADYCSKAGSGYILCQNNIYQLNPDVPLDIDTERFLHYYAQGIQQKEHMPAHFETACRLYTGPFLSEDLYACWSSPQREQLAQIYLRMCLSLAEYHLHQGNYHEALGWADAVVKENSCEERAYQILMKAYAGDGKRGEVLRQYRRCEQVLKEELGLTPMAETQQLFTNLFKCSDL